VNDIKKVNFSELMNFSLDKELSTLGNRLETITTSIDIGDTRTKKSKKCVTFNL
jgi:hypothetical protein